MKSEYYNKQEFVKDFITYCRAVKRAHNASHARQTYYCNKFIGVCGESWKFGFYISSDTVATDATLLSCGTQYPKTKWGGFGRRWDTELREFLSREVNKS